MRRYLPASICIFTVVILLAAPIAFASTQKEAGDPTKVMAVQTYLADIAQNIAGNRVKISALLPLGADPHAFQPTPADVKQVAQCNVLIINGAGFEEYLDELLQNVRGVRKIIDASAGLSFRSPGKDESAGTEEKDHHHEAEHHHKTEPHHAGHHHEGDPHFWLSPVNVIRYVENIRNGLTGADPGGAEIYSANAATYTAKLRELDQWISDQVKEIPENKRLLVTDHDDFGYFGYFSDRYGFRIIGMVIPSFSTEASPSAKHTAQLVKKIRKTGVKAILLEAGEAPQLAEQIAREAGIKVVTGLHTHSVTQPDGPAPNYIEMMRFNTTAIVNALK
ncbi:MAG: metal ABC transporter substrate-binding protein [Syntrophobacteraceae bacterium]